MKRRDFLQNSISSLGASALINFMPSWSHAFLNDPSVIPSQYFILVVFENGWDVTLGLEPWLASQRPDQSELFIEYTDDQILQAGTLKLGPAMKAMLPFSQDLCLINGIIMSDTDNGHDALRSYMITGDGQGKTASVAAEITDIKGSYGYGVLTNSNVYSADRLIETTGISEVIALNESQLNSLSSIANPQTAIQKAQALKFLNKSKELKLVQKLNEWRANGTQISDAHAIAASFMMALTQTVQLRYSFSLDTHSGHEKKHLEEQTKAWQQLADLLNVLKANTDDGVNSLLSKTTIMVASEFARTPALNAALGKDHNNFLNSCLLMGPGIKGQTQIGGSRVISRKDSPTGNPIHIGLPCDFQTGVPFRTKSTPQQGLIISPESVLATVADSMKISRARFGCVATKEPSLKTALKS